jgi:hypothetical protein
MGYTTEFQGEVKVTPAMKPEHIAYINAFSESRRMKRDAVKAAGLSDPVREAAGLPVGPNGAYYVGSADSNCGQDDDGSILDSNGPPEGQPGLWCQWVVTEYPDGDTVIEHDGGEKFYDYTVWMAYLIEHFLEPWGYTVDGEIEWRGEDSHDSGTLVVEANQVSANRR